MNDARPLRHFTQGVTTTESPLGIVFHLKLTDENGVEPTGEDIDRAYAELDATGWCVKLRRDFLKSLNGARPYPYPEHATVHDVTPEWVAVRNLDAPRQVVNLDRAEFYRCYEVD